VALIVAFSHGLGGCAGGLPFLPASTHDVETTGSISEAPVLSPQLSDGDNQRAAVALNKALDPMAAGNPVEWSSPESGYSGSFAAIGQAYVHDDQVCRGFLASLAADGQRNWMQGAACRAAAGRWRIEAVKSWERS
jgi:surface antigen